MIHKRKKYFDGTDKDILRILYLKHPLVTSEIAKVAGLTVSGIIPRLVNLMEKGILKKEVIGQVRTFDRKFGDKIKRVNSPSSIMWNLDIKNGQ